MPEYVLSVTAANGGSVSTPPVTGFVECVITTINWISGEIDDIGLQDKLLRTLTAFAAVGADSTNYDYPRVQATDTAGADIADLHVRLYVVHSPLTLSVTGTYTGTIEMRILISEV